MTSGQGALLPSLEGGGVLAATSTSAFSIRWPGLFVLCLGASGCWCQNLILGGTRKERWRRSTRAQINPLGNQIFDFSASRGLTYPNPTNLQRIVSALLVLLEIPIRPVYLGTGILDLLS